MSKIVIDRDAAAQDAEERARPEPTITERERATMTEAERDRARAAEAYWSGALAEATERTIRALRRARWINAGPTQRATVIARLRAEHKAHAAAASQATPAEIAAVRQPGKGGERLPTLREWSSGAALVKKTGEDAFEVVKRR